MVTTQARSGSAGRVRLAAQRGVPTQQPSSPAATTVEFTPEQWHDMVAQAAYFRAEQRGFAAGCELEDWFEAEVELRHRFAPT